MDHMYYCATGPLRLRLVCLVFVRFNILEREEEMEGGSQAVEEDDGKRARALCHVNIRDGVRSGS